VGDNPSFIAGFRIPHGTIAEQTAVTASLNRIRENTSTMTSFLLVSVFDGIYPRWPAVTQTTDTPDVQKAGNSMLACCRISRVLKYLIGVGSRNRFSQIFRSVYSGRPLWLLRQPVQQFNRGLTFHCELRCSMPVRSRMP